MNTLGKDKLDLVSNRFGQFLEILLVFLWENDSANAGSMGGKDLFLHPTYRQDKPVHRDFAGLGGVTSEQPQ